MTHLNTVAVLIIVGLSIPRVLEAVTKDPDCDKTKGCFYECEDDTLCEFLVSWVDMGDNVTYTLTTNSESANIWMAIGFSDDQLMGNDSVTGCTYYKDDIEAFNAKNPVKSMPQKLDNEGVTLLKGNKDDKDFMCSFQRVKAADVKFDRFDLYQPWYLLFAKGQINEFGVMQGHGPENQYCSKHKRDTSSRSPTTATPEATTSLPTTTTTEATTVTSTTTTEATTVSTTTTEVTTDPATTAAVVTTAATTTADAVTTVQSTTTAVVTTAATTTADAVTTVQSTTAAVVTTAATTTADAVTTVQSTTAAATTVPTTPAQVPTPQPSGPPVHKLKGCGTTVGCFSDCVGMVCSFIVSWQVQETDAIYTMVATVARKASAWLAAGFSNDALMGDDDVLGCMSDTTGQVVPFTGWNTKFGKPDMYTDNEIKLIDKRSEDGLLSCTFRRPIAPASSGNLAASQSSRRVDVSKPWTLFIARGPGRIKPDGISLYYHNKERFISAQKASVNDCVDLGSIYHEYPLVKIHGGFMIIAWIFASSVGFILARYYRSFSGSRLFFGYAWLHAHRFCMLVVLVATIAGFVIIYIQSGGYSFFVEDQGFLRAHPILGIIIMIMAVSNPLSAAIRPTPGSPRRIIFDWTHRIIGLAAHVLAVVNIFFGVQLGKADVPYYLVYIVAAYTAWQLLVTIVLESLSWFGRKSYDVQVDDTSLTATSEIPIAQESSRTLLTKEIIYWLNCAVLLAIAILLIVLLCLGSKHMGL